MKDIIFEDLSDISSHVNFLPDAPWDARMGSDVEEYPNISMPTEDVRPDSFSC